MVRSGALQMGAYWQSSSCGHKKPGSYQAAPERVLP